ncbi:MAG: hypothetical protein PHE89_08205 [Alphaproteobacteria bacterium]|nr:hypothetical protein [Alphaproteobacteria bacterium]
MKNILSLLIFPIGRLNDALARFYVAVQENDENNYFSSGLDVYDMFYLVTHHKQQKEIQPFLKKFFLTFLVENQTVLEESMFNEYNIFQLACCDRTLALEVMVLAQFYYGKNISEEDLEKIAQSYDNFEEYSENHFWGIIASDMRGIIRYLSN